MLGNLPLHHSTAPAQPGLPSARRADGLPLVGHNLYRPIVVVTNQVVVLLVGDLQASEPVLLGTVLDDRVTLRLDAETMLGHGDLAWQYFRATLPSAWNSRAEIREIEPYVYCQFTHSKYSPRFGASRVPWLSGSAAWSFFTVTQYILGLRPEYGGLRIDPCIPAAWKSFTVTRVFRGKKVLVEIRNPAGVQKGVRKLLLNGEPLDGNLIPAERLTEENRVVVEMG